MSEEIDIPVNDISLDIESDYQDWVKQNIETKKKVPSSIRKRWVERVIPRGLHQMGEGGALQYLADYGRGISSPKCIDLARQALAEGCEEMALGFFKKAYELETGRVAPSSGSVQGQMERSIPTPSAQVEEVSLDGFPAHLQPGRTSTQQPVDATESREHYRDNDEYWGQRKVDGNRLVVFASHQGIFYQSRSLNLRDPPSLDIEKGLLVALEKEGEFIIDCEVVYKDVLGKDHRTGSQAAHVNVKEGRPEVHPKACLAIFKALFALGVDLTDKPEADRITLGERIGGYLQGLDSESFESLETYRTREEKQALMDKVLQNEGEGEVWVRHSCTYKGGKDKSAQDIVRTKHLQTLDVVVTGLTQTTAEGRLFGAAEVSVMSDGQMTSIGRVASGFSQEDMQKLVDRVRQENDRPVISIITQGLTERNQVMHARFDEFRDDKSPNDCTLE